MDEIKILCPLAGAYIADKDCEQCRFHTRGVHCPVHKCLVPFVLCAACLKEDAARPCSMAGANAHLYPIEQVPDQTALCSFPRKCHAIKLSGPHPLHKFKKEK